MCGMTKSTVSKSSEQEKFVAKFLELRRSPQSGAGLRFKGDCFDEESLFECKTTMTKKESFTVKKAWFDKLNRERSEDRKQFAFLVSNFGGNGNEDNHVTMSLETFRELYWAWKNIALLVEE
jgi:hypothetical protein